MTDKPDKANLPSGEGAVDAIRNIIFGEREKYFQAKLEAIEKKLEELKKDYQGKIDQLNQVITSEREQFEKSLREIAQSLNSTGQNLDQVISTLRNDLEEKLEALEKRKISHSALSTQFKKLADHFKDA